MKAVVLSLTIFCLLFVGVFNASAYNTGLINYAAVGCGNGCHATTVSPTTLSLSGSTTLSPNEQTTLTLLIQNSSHPRSGLNIDFVNSSTTRIAGLGVISGQGMFALTNELTHLTPKVISGGQSSWAFTLTAPATPGQYTVRIAGIASTSFTTADWTTMAQSILVRGVILSAPSGGQTFCIGSTIGIQWNSYAINNVNIQLSSDGGANYSTIASVSSSNGANSYNYTVPASTQTGTAYRLRVVDANDATSSAAMTSNFTIIPGHSITSQPTPATQSVCQGATVSYSVVALGQNLSYQWRKDGQNLNGATSSIVNLNSVTTAQSGSYDCVVSSSCGAPQTSASAMLTVEPAPSITSQPQSVTLCEGSTTTFSVSASGTALSYQWIKNGANIVGATSTNYTVRNIQLSDGGQYACKVTGTCPPTATSSPATLSVVSTPMFTTNPVTSLKCEGTVLNLGAAVQNANGLNYEWIKDGVTLSSNSRISGTSTLNLVINPLLAIDAGVYQVRAMASACQSVTLSGSAQVTVNTSPVISSHPQSKTVPVGASVSFNVAAAGSELMYQWKKNTSLIVSATNSTYTITSASTGDEASYSVLITNACGTSTSNVALLTISTQAQPVITLSSASKDVGRIRIGSSQQFTFDVSNTGNANLVVTALVVRGPQSASFTTTETNFSVAPTQKHTVTMKFTPQVRGTNHATISLLSNAIGDAELQLSGAGLDHVLDPLTIDFPHATSVGSSRDTSVRICNTTTADLVISDMVPSGDVSFFRVIEGIDLSKLPLNLSRDSCMLTRFEFKPTNAGTALMSMILSTSQGNDTLTLRGTATASTEVPQERSSAILSPNPASDWVSIRNDCNVTFPVLVTVFDILGHIINKMEIHETSPTISTDSLVPGMYRIEVRSASLWYSTMLSIVR